MANPINMDTINALLTNLLKKQEENFQANLNFALGTQQANFSKALAAQQTNFNRALTAQQTSFNKALAHLTKALSSQKQTLNQIKSNLMASSPLITPHVNLTSFTSPHFANQTKSHPFNSSSAAPHLDQTNIVNPSMINRPDTSHFSTNTTFGPTAATISTPIISLNSSFAAPHHDQTNTVAPPMINRPDISPFITNTTFGPTAATISTPIISLNSSFAAPHHDQTNTVAPPMINRPDTSPFSTNTTFGPTAATTLNPIFALAHDREVSKNATQLIPITHADPTPVIDLINNGGAPQSFMSPNTKVDPPPSLNPFQGIGASTQPNIKRPIKLPLKRNTTVLQQAHTVEKRCKNGSPCAFTISTKQRGREVATITNQQPYKSERKKFTDLGIPLSTVYEMALEADMVRPLEPKEPPSHPSRNYKPNEYCKYHQGAGHETDMCKSLKHRIQDLIDNGDILPPEPLPNVPINLRDVINSLKLKREPTQ